ncbi:hypothetical protein ACFL08_00315 [Patescibacteria group bacterium]
MDAITLFLEIFAVSDRSSLTDRDVGNTCDIRMSNKQWMKLREIIGN